MCTYRCPRVRPHVARACALNEGAVPADSGRQAGLTHNAETTLGPLGADSSESRFLRGDVRSRPPGLELHHPHPLAAGISWAEVLPPSLGTEAREEDGLVDKLRFLLKCRCSGGEVKGTGLSVAVLCVFH